nr:endonuclease MutS2 [Bacilli bacterium]
MNDRVLVKLSFDVIREDIVKKCSTPYGQALAYQIRPFALFEEAVSALKMTQQAYSVYARKGAPPFPDAFDIRPAVAKAKNSGILSPQELAAIGMTVNKARRVYAFLLSLEDRLDLSLLMPLAQKLVISKELEEEIARCIDEDALVKDSASPTLYDIRRKISVVKDRMRRSLEEMVRSPGLQKVLQDTIITMRHDRYCLAVRADSASQVRGIVHDASASGATLFIEPERVLQLGNELRRHEAQEEEEVERIVMALSALVATYAPELTAMIAALGDLDVALAKASYASATKAHEPTLIHEPRIHLRKARHPLIDPSVAVPIDLRLGDQFHLLIITGPNTGGKTVTLKTVGLLTMMALSGLFIPAAEGSTIGFFREIFADIGDEQSIEQNLSTFSSHMKTIIQMLDQADERSLLLFDELGAGTDPTEGAALAMAILDDVRERNIVTMATTHYSELKAYGYTSPGAMNASMEFDVETLSPTYRLMIGVPGRSNAFAIAARLGLSDAIIQVAMEKMTTQDVRVEDLIRQLEASVIAVRQEEEEVKRANQTIKAREQQWEQRYATLEEDLQKHRQKARDELSREMKQAQNEMEELLQSLREKQNKGQSLKDHEVTMMRHQFQQIAPAKTLRTVAKAKTAKVPDEGDEVRVLSLAGQKAVVIEKRMESQELTVALGAMKVKVGIQDVELIKKAQQRKETATMVTRSNDHVAPELDLRGTNVEEASVMVDRYLDKAILAGYHQVSLIHGKGTGALRQGLTAYLRTHPHVAGQRLGVEGEGGSGVTIVRLR